MLGFDISLWHQVDDWNKPFAQRKGFIAAWEADLGGIDWLVRLRRDGTARFVDRCGYPDHYFLPAGVLAGILRGGPPKHGGGVTIGEDYVLPGGWTGSFAGQLSDLAGCPPEEELLIEVWDLS